MAVRDLQPLRIAPGLEPASQIGSRDEWKVRDAVGKIVPRRLRPIFDKRGYLWTWTMRLAALRAEIAIHDGAPHCRDIDIEKVVGLLDKASAEIRWGLPDSTCPCEWWELNCPLCGGTGWVSAKQKITPQPRAIAKMMGRVVELPVMTCPASGVEQTSTRLLGPDGSKFRIVAYGDLAKPLSAVGVNQPLEVSGRLVMYTWKADGIEYERTKIVVEDMSQIPLEQWRDEVADAR
jgi:hypothetical protein